MEIRKKNNQKRVLTSVFLLLAIILVGAIFFLIWKPFETPSIKQATGSVELSPPTKQEQQAANDQKAINEKREEEVEKTKQQQGPKQVTPVITYADQDSVSMYVSGIYEDNGTCTAKLTRGPLSFEKSSSGFKDATTTGCAPIDFVASDFQEKGDWQLVVSYSSPTAQGNSNRLTIVVK